MGLQVLYNHLPEVPPAIKKARTQLLLKAAFDVQAQAQSRAPVATGFLKSSIYVRTETMSTYGTGVGEGAHGSYLLPEVEAPDGYNAYVAVGANYGQFIEYGTSKMAAQPYLIPAADAVRPTFIAAWNKLEDYIRENL